MGEIIFAALYFVSKIETEVTKQWTKRKVNKLEEVWKEGEQKQSSRGNGGWNVRMDEKLLR